MKGFGSKGGKKAAGFVHGASKSAKGTKKGIIAPNLAPSGIKGK
jgi:hypothetical protein